MLFNLTADPVESTDLAASHPEIVSVMLGRLNDAKAMMIPAVKTTETAAGNPANFGGAFSPGWCESKP